MFSGSSCLYGMPRPMAEASSYNHSLMVRFTRCLTGLANFRTCDWCHELRYWRFPLVMSVSHSELDGTANRSTVRLDHHGNRVTECRQSCMGRGGLRSSGDFPKAMAPVGQRFLPGPLTSWPLLEYPLGVRRVGAPSDRKPRITPGFSHVSAILRVIREPGQAPLRFRPVKWNRDGEVLWRKSFLQWV